MADANAVIRSLAQQNADLTVKLTVAQVELSEVSLDLERAMLLLRENGIDYSRARDHDGGSCA